MCHKVTVQLKFGAGNVYILSAKDEFSKNKKLSSCCNQVGCVIRSGLIDMDYA